MQSNRTERTLIAYYDPEKAIVDFGFSRLIGVAGPGAAGWYRCELGEPDSRGVHGVAWVGPYETEECACHGCPQRTVRYVNAPADVVRRMSEREVWLFERGFAAYADGLPHDHVPAYENIDERRWWLKGWYAGRNANECINGNR